MDPVYTVVHGFLHYTEYTLWEYPVPESTRCVHETDAYTHLATSPGQKAFDSWNVADLHHALAAVQQCRMIDILIKK